MALTELQLPDKAAFYNACQSVAGESRSRYMRWKNFSDFIQAMDVADMDAMGIGAGQVRTDLASLREALDSMILNFETAEVGTTGKTAMEIMDGLRKALII